MHAARLPHKNRVAKEARRGTILKRRLALFLLVVRSQIRVLQIQFLLFYYGNLLLMQCHISKRRK
jgi:hypothetical protein